MTFTAGARPCSTCPYVRSTPPGVWAESEYRKLPEFDPAPDGSLAMNQAVFLCHKANPADDVLCRGWLITHRGELLGLRLAAFRGRFMDWSLCDPVPGVECYESGQEACDAGMAGIEAPSVDAQRRIGQIAAVRERVGAPVKFK